MFDIQLLAKRLTETTSWLQDQPEVRGLPIGFLGASTAAAALWAAADLVTQVRAVVSRGGRPDLAAPRLAEVRAPTLLIVGGHDEPVPTANRRARARLRCPNACRSSRAPATGRGSRHPWTGWRP